MYIRKGRGAVPVLVGGDGFMIHQVKDVYYLLLLFMNIARWELVKEDSEKSATCDWSGGRAPDARSGKLPISRDGWLLSSSLPRTTCNTYNMLSASSRSAFTRANHLTRSFATTARVAQAVQKPVLEKEFKIYRWVCAFLLLDASYSRENSKLRVLESWWTFQETHSAVLQNWLEPMWTYGESAGLSPPTCLTVSCWS